MEILFGLIILVFSAIIHEVTHGYVADRLGDPTARLSGRLTLNPKSHIDPIMSIFLPLLLMLSGSPVIFGAAKPVPVDPFNLRDGRKDMALVALAGPLINICIAILASILLHIINSFSYLIPPQSFILTAILLSKFFLITVATYNLLLGIFNLLPIPPLDGSKVFALLFPAREAEVFLSFGRFGFFIIFFLLLYPIGGFSLQSFIANIYTFASSLLGLY